MSVINTNVKALYTQGALKVSGRESTVAMQQLSTGKRINSAKDDAAGLAIATRMTQQIRSLNQAVRNAGDAISLIQVAEGATMEITDMLQRMRELAIQAINDTNAGEQRAYLDLEFQQLKQEIVRISDTTEWNGFSILNGTVGERVGERPVYKTTAQSEFGQVMINPTSVRTVSGADAGEQQTVKFSGPATTGGLLTVGGVDVNINAGDSAAEIATKVKLAMEATTAYAPNTNRKIVVNGDMVSITFPYSEKNVPKIATNISAGLLGVNAVTAPNAVTAVAQIDSVKLSGALAEGDQVAIALNGVQVSATAQSDDVEAFANVIASKVNASTDDAHAGVVATVGTGSATKAMVVDRADTHTYELSAIAANQTVIVAGLTFTAGANGASGADVAAALGKGVAGTYPSGAVSGTITAGYALEQIPGTTKIKFTEVSDTTDLTATTGTAAAVTPTKIAGATVGNQKATLTLGGTFVAGQEVSITIDGTPGVTGKVVSYVVQAADVGSTDEQTRVNLAAKLATAYNTSTDVDVAKNTAVASNNTLTITADAGTTKFAVEFSATKGVINLTAREPGTAFVATVAATPVSPSGTLTAVRSAQRVSVAADEPAPNRVEAVAQVDTVKLAGTIGAGGVVQVDVGGVPISVTASGVDTAQTLATALAQKFNDSIDPAHTGITATVGTGSIATASTVSPFEKATFDYASPPTMASGDTLTIAGLVYTANGTQPTAADLRAAFTGGSPVNGSVSGTLTGYTAATSGTDSIVFTATTAGNVPDLKSALTKPLAATTRVQGNGTTTETAAFNFTTPPIMAVGDKLTIAGIVYTAGATTPTAADLVAAFTGGSPTNGTVSGSITAYTSVDSTGNVVTFTSSTTNTDVTDLTGTLELFGAATSKIDGPADGKQVDTLSIANTFVVGQEITLTVGGQPLVFKVKSEHIGATDAITRQNVVNALSNAFNSSTNAAHTPITASVTGSYDLKLTADLSGMTFTASGAVEVGVVSFTSDTAGEPFTSAVSATSTITAELRYSQANIRTVSGEAITSTDETFANNGKFLRSGALNISLSAAGVVTSSFTTTDYQVVPLTGVLDEAAGTITFAATGDNSKILSDALTYTFKSDNGNIVPLGGREVVLDVGVVGSIPVMGTGDLIINGVTINASYASDDKLSPPNNAAGSAIAKAAAINRESAATGVNAVVNTNIMAGTAQSGTSAVTGRVVINGVTSPTFTTVMNNTRASRIAAVDAINRISDITGVVAVNSNSESEGIALVAKDGRNIEVSFDTPDSAADFSARTGLREGVQAGTFSLESRVEGPIVISTSATGNVHNAGLTVGDYTANVSTMSTVTPDVVPGNTLPVALGTGDLVINGVPIRGATSADDKFTERAALLTTSNVSTGSGIAFANAVNASSELTGVTATPNPVVALGSRTTINSATPDGFKSLFVNGVDVRVEFKATHTASERVQAVINAVNPLTGPTGVTASANLQGGVTFTTLDGRNLSVWFDDTNISAAEFGLATQSGANADGVSGKSTAPTLANASTLYGGVTFHSAKAFTIEPGGNGYGPNSNFTALGLTEGTFGGVVDSAVSKMTPPNTGRLSFHVGASANQIITIDLSDFGDGGTITSDITSDVDLWDSDKRVNRIDTGAAAAATLEKLDAVMDKVNGTRATMGAVMNRLEHVIDNLMNVSMNTEASRSQIEDADYAAASTELARTQIMQQAATSVLAQANADQQNVLKLLQ